jgi:hypothetical protein
MRTITHEEWMTEAKSRFGNDAMKWSFECPVCKHIAAVKDWHDAKAPEGAIAFSCVGRYVGGKVRNAFEEEGKGPCNYAGGGLFALNPVTVTGGPGGDHHVFEFASTKP